MQEFDAKWVSGRRFILTIFIICVWQVKQNDQKFNQEDPYSLQLNQKPSMKRQKVLKNHLWLFQNQPRNHRIKRIEILETPN